MDSIRPILVSRGVAATALAALIAFGVTTTGAQRPRPTVEVYKTSTCGCCANWVKHLEQHGFLTRVTNVENITQVKVTHNVPGHRGRLRT